MTKKEARTPEQFSADPAAIELLHRAETTGPQHGIHARREHGSLPHRQPWHVLLDVPDGALPHHQGWPGGRLRRHLGNHRRPRLCPPRGRRQRRPLGPRPRPGVHAQGRGQGRGQGLQDPRPVQAQDGGGAPGHRDRGPSDLRHRQRRRRQGDCRIRPAEGRACLSAPCAQEALRAVEGTGPRPTRHRPRGGRGAAPHPHGRRPGRRAHPGPGHALRPVRRLGRLHAGHGHLGRPVWHPQPAWSPRSTWACSRTTRSTSSSTATNPRCRRCW